MLAQLIPGLETVMESNMGPKPVKMTSFKSGPRPFGRVKRTFLGHFGPGLNSYMAIPGTGYQILDTDTPGKGRVEGLGGNSPPPPLSPYSST